MAGEWKETTLGAEVDLLTGFPFKSEHYTDSADSIPLVRGDNIVQGAMRWDGVKRWPISERGEHELYELREGDVVLAMDRPWIEAGLKYAAISKHDLPCLLVQRTARLRGGPKLNTGYLRYLIGSLEFTQHIHAITTGTAVPHISGRQIKDFTFALPPLAEQKAIAAVLGALDDKIELNRRMNATLEAMARALFQSWFVDFDPVRAKLDGRKPIGLDEATAALFPASFQESSLGTIPHGWEVKTLGEVIELAYGKPLKAEDRKNGPVCVYGSNGSIGWHDEKLVAGPGIVVGRKGNPGVVTWAHGDFYPIDTTFYVEPIGACRSLHFFYYALSLQNLANLSADSAVPGLNRNHAYMSKQVIPSQPVLKAFDLQIAPIFASIHSNEEQSRTLATLRDTLLPKLLSGELRVADVAAKMPIRL